MTLTERAVLEIELDDGTTGVFELRDALEEAGEVQKEFLMGNAGGVIREAVDIGADLLPDDIAEADLERRKGYHVDGGGGQYLQTLSFEVGPDDAPWGDGSSAAGEVTKHDASGEVPLTSKRQIFDWYVAQARTDSQGQAHLHIGEWTDGTYSDGDDAGAFERPMTVAVMESRITKSSDDPTKLEGSVDVVWTAVFPDVDIVGGVEEGLENLIPDN